MGNGPQTSKYNEIKLRSGKCSKWTKVKGMKWWGWACFSVWDGHQRSLSLDKLSRVSTKKEGSHASWGKETVTQSSNSGLRTQLPEPLASVPRQAAGSLEGFSYGFFTHGSQICADSFLASENNYFIIFIQFYLFLVWRPFWYKLCCVG